MPNSLITLQYPLTVAVATARKEASPADTKQPPRAGSSAGKQKGDKAGSRESESDVDVILDVPDEVTDASTHRDDDTDNEDGESQAETVSDDEKKRPTSSRYEKLVSRKCSDTDGPCESSAQEAQPAANGAAQGKDDDDSDDSGDNEVEGESLPLSDAQRDNVVDMMHSALQQATQTDEDGIAQLSKIKENEDLGPHIYEGAKSLVHDVVAGMTGDSPNDGGPNGEDDLGPAIPSKGELDSRLNKEMEKLKGVREGVFKPVGEDKQVAGEEGRADEGRAANQGDTDTMAQATMRFFGMAPETPEEDDDAAAGSSNASRSQDANANHAKAAVDKAGSGEDGPQETNAMEEGDNVDAPMELDIHKMVRKEISVLRRDGYLAGNATYHRGESGMFMIAIFPCDSSHATFILTSFEDIGLGIEFGNITVSPLEFTRTSYIHQGWNNPERIEDRRKRRAQRRAEKSDEHAVPLDMGSDSSGGPEDSDEEDGKERTRRQARRDRKLSLASEIRVQQILDQLRDGCRFDFDHVAYLVTASVIAGAGLAINSGPTIVASMLVSPLMGPIMAFCFGGCMHEWQLCWRGLANTLVSVLICVVIGFLASLVALPFLSKEDTWPTFEMASRGEPLLLAVGAIVAAFSGFGVALSTLSADASSLVGVAISAALLPPAVNAGMMWCFALLSQKIRPAWEGRETALAMTDAAVQGTVSFTLVMMNITLVIIFAGIMFWFKQVSPSTQREAYWKHDIKQVRKIKGKDRQARKSSALSKHKAPQNGDSARDSALSFDRSEREYERQRQFVLRQRSRA